MRGFSLSKKCGFIALAGRPNAGKSTFLNKVLGEKISIVSDKPQTTRDCILGIYQGKNTQIGFLDLPGIHKPQHAMNRMMMRAVTTGLEDADVIFHFIDVSQEIGKGDRFVRDFLKQRDVPVILVANKMDLVNKAKVLPTLQLLSDEFDPTELVPISALEGDNTERLLEVGAQFLPEGDFRFEQDEITDKPMRFIAREYIREKVLHFTKFEIPHAVAVTIQTYEESPEGVHIEATLWCERSSQRGILLGKSGQMISKIRSAAKRSLKRFLNQPVQIELYVKVQENWRNNDKLLGEVLG
jgi:GTP-binding protein Era